MCCFRYHTVEQRIVLTPVQYLVFVTSLEPDFCSWFCSYCCFRVTNYDGRYIFQFVCLSTRGKGDIPASGPRSFPWGVPQPLVPGPFPASGPSSFPEGGSTPGRAGQGYPPRQDRGVPPHPLDRRASDDMPWAVCLLQSRRRTFL